MGKLKRSAPYTGFRGVLPEDGGWGDRRGENLVEIGLEVQKHY